ncbi:MAG: OmpA family protein [Gemmobacter sp.]|uniref:OmpA family protein n=1 Tax=Gemmobacter sp. TaxID=1898957 RepID=UPI001A4722C3|nr:OmpA family protein [Gemmobacter sp.]MBL8561135.1 OmpA family protein [Gemmobacter sp.]
MRFLLPFLLLSSPVAAQTFDFGAEAVQTAQEVEPDATALIATAPWAAGAPQGLRDGTLEQTAWRIDTPQSTLDLAARLQAQLEAAGWKILFTCETRGCGGFDFRYQLPLLNEPDMHVDLGDFRYVSAEKGGEALSLTISRATGAGFVQLTRVTPGARAPETPTVAPVAPLALPAPVSDLGARLEASGAVVLGDLVFASGKAALEPGDYASLRALADYMAARPEAKIALVGHTDASGGLAGNVALSEARAGAVRKVLISLGIQGERIEAKGVGYLAPRASNLTPEGRTQNRRVEVMLTSTQVGAAP